MEKTDKQKQISEVRKKIAQQIVVHPKDSPEGKKQREAFLNRWNQSHDSF
jgi:hypothetical protein